MAQNVYIDESGSITNEYADRYPFFVIAALHVFNKPVLKKAFKRFISSNYDELKKTDRQKKMFDSAGNFSELKGCCMTPKMKEKFLNFFPENHCSRYSISSWIIIDFLRNFLQIRQGALIIF